MKRMTVQQFRRAMRQAIADYMSTEGCSCCRDIEGHEKNAATIAKLLHVSKYNDGSGYNFRPYRTKVEPPHS